MVGVGVYLQRGQCLHGSSVQRTLPRLLEMHTGCWGRGSGKGITRLVSEAGSGAHSESSSHLPKEGQGEKFYLGL